MCNDTKENFLWELARIKLNVTFHKNCEKNRKSSENFVCKTSFYEV